MNFRKYTWENDDNTHTQLRNNNSHRGGLDFDILQLSQPLLRIIDFREGGINVFPEVEEFFCMLNGFSFLAFFFIQFSQLAETQIGPHIPSMHVLFLSGRIGEGKQIAS